MYRPPSVFMFAGLLVLVLAAGADAATFEVISGTAQAAASAGTVSVVRPVALVTPAAPVNQSFAQASNGSLSGSFLAGIDAKPTIIKTALEGGTGSSGGTGSGSILLNFLLTD